MADEMKVMKILLKNNCKGIMVKEDSETQTSVPNIVRKCYLN